MRLILRLPPPSGQVIVWATTECHLKGEECQYTWKPERAHVQWFRLYDDDGELYFTGFMESDLPIPQDEILFDPLDWARVNYGATEIHYKNEKGKWEQI